MNVTTIYMLFKNHVIYNKYDHDIHTMFKKSNNIPHQLNDICMLVK